MRGCLSFRERTQAPLASELTKRWNAESFLTVSRQLMAVGTLYGARVKRQRKENQMAPTTQRLMRPRLRMALAIVLVVGISLPTHAFGQGLVSSQSAPTVQTGPLLAADNFHDPSGGLLPPSSPEPDDYEQGYEDGNYVVRAISPMWSGSVGLPLAGSYRDTMLSVNVRSVGDRPGAVYLQCRRSATGGYSAVLFLDRGFYFLARFEGASTSPLVFPSFSPYARLRHAGINLALSCVEIGRAHV